jgi:D-glycero-D-manno-heptose 1,7-bisphosphate phosphatase
VLNRAIFLDRDGTINKEVDYLTKPEQVVLIKGTKKALLTFKELGFLNIVITNQSAIARGFLTEKKLFEIHARLLELLTHSSESLIYDIFYCPFHNEGIVNEFAKNSFNRKPNPGLILKAAIKYKIDLSKSFLIGDSYTDMKCAENAGIKKILVLTGYGEETLIRCSKEKMKIECVVNNLFEASKFIKKYLEY